MSYRVLRTAAGLAAVVSATVVLTTSPATAATVALTATTITATDGNPVRWSESLTTGDPAGVTVDPSGVVRLNPATRWGLAGSSTEATGLLTLPAHRLGAPADRIGTSVSADLPPGSTATVDVRGARTFGGWSEWLPATGGAVTLPEPTSQVQERLVLTGSTTALPAVTALDLHAYPAVWPQIAVAKLPMRSYRVFATREGLVGESTANGHVIGEQDQFVALPSRRALSPQDSGDYTVRVCAPAAPGRAKRCAFAPVWDVGPWNTRDDYWNPAGLRQNWDVLDQGIPQAQAARLDGFNDGRDQFDREVLNPAGIDLSDALFTDTLGLATNSWVTVDYLWTGSGPLSTVRGDGPLDVRSAPSAAADIVGIAAQQAKMPVECLVSERWLKIGDGQFVPVAAASVPPQLAGCPAADGAPVDRPAANGSAVAGPAVAAPAMAAPAPDRPASDRSAG